MRITTLTLKLPIHPGDLPGLRACIADLVGFEHELFHNHDNSLPDSEHLHWGYPLVQYSVRRGYATITGLAAGAKAIESLLLPKLPESLTFGGQSWPVGEYQLHTHQVALEWSEEPLHYGISGWVGLNAENYQAWKADPDEDARKLVLSRAFTGHLRALGHGLGLPDFARAIGEVTKVDNQKRIAWHGTQLVRFDIQVATNLSLPLGVGLGRSVAFGFGEIMSPSYYQQYLRVRKSRNLQSPKP